MSISGFLQKNKALSIIAALAVVLIIIFFSFAFSSLSDKTVPSQFSDSRQTASEYATEIVSLLSVTTGRVSQVQKLVEERRHAQALTIVMEEIDKNKDIREKAIQLALELEKMAKAIPDIDSSEAAQIALVATSKETALIGKLLSYTNELSNLLGLLRIAVSVAYPDYSNINESIVTINSAAVEINKLNEEYKAEMENFDRVINGEEVVSTPSISPSTSPVLN